MYLLIITIGVSAGIISGIVGTGASIILLPVLAYVFGTKSAIPIMAIAAIMGNISRVIMWRRDIKIKAFLIYSIPAFPAVVMGANTLWIMPVVLSNIIIGVFFILLIPLRIWAKSKNLSLNNLQLGIMGATVGYLTGIVFSTGPLTIPIFSGYGLMKGGLLSTEAASSFVIYFAKVSTFEEIGALPWPVFISGLLVGFSLIFGIYIGKRFVLKISERNFNYLIDFMMLFSGVAMLWDALKEYFLV